MPSPCDGLAWAAVDVTMGLTHTRLHSGHGPRHLHRAQRRPGRSTFDRLHGPDRPTAARPTASKTYVGAPGATTVALTTWRSTGEGSASQRREALQEQRGPHACCEWRTRPTASTSATAGLANGGIVSECRLRDCRTRRSTRGARPAAPRPTRGSTTPSTERRPDGPQLLRHQRGHAGRLRRHRHRERGRRRRHRDALGRLGRAASSPTPTAPTGCSFREPGRPTATATPSTRSSTPQSTNGRGHLVDADAGHQHRLLVLGLVQPGQQRAQPMGATTAARASASPPTTRVAPTARASCRTPTAR